MRFLLAFTFLSTTLLSYQARGQASPYQHPRDSAIEATVKMYTSAIGAGLGLYNGYQYPEFEFHSNDVGYPYFLSDDWSKGRVLYDHQVYHGVFLLFDVVKEKVVVEHPSNNAKIELISEKVTSFSIGNHHFVSLATDSTKLNPIPDGFYDLLYDGRVKVYAHREKEIEKKLEFNIYVHTYKEKDKYYIRKEGSYYPVKTKSSVLKIFKDQKPAVKKQLAASKIKFNKHREGAICLMASAYDLSSKQ